MTDTAFSCYCSALLCFTAVWRGWCAGKVNPASGVAEIATDDLTPPASGLFIKGRARPYWNAGATAITGVAHGIDAYYVQQGKGGELERRAPEGVPQEILVPLEMRIALGSNGTAVLTNHRWNSLGIGMTIRNQAPPAPPRPPQPVASRAIKSSA